MWKVGHAFARTSFGSLERSSAASLPDTTFRDFFNCDSGILASLLVLQAVKMLKAEGQTIGSFIDSIVRWANSGEVNYTLNEKDEAMTALYERYVKNDSPTLVMDFDGYRVEFKDWWFNVRKSNTNPTCVGRWTPLLLDEKLADQHNRFIRR